MTLPALPPREREVTLRFVVEPADLNLYGKVHGGAVMKWIDQAGHACAVGWSGHDCVTVYVGGIRFYKPIVIGRLVEIHARLIYTGRTSMHMAVDVRSRDLQTQACEPTTHCVTVFVAMDGNGQPVEVPAWKPVTPSDQALHDYAARVMALSKNLEEAMRPHLPQPGSL